MVACGVGSVIGAHKLLYIVGALPPPTITGTSCINEKFLDLRNAELGSRNFLAVGSSVTWRNLDGAALMRALPDASPYNAAPCYIHVDQIAFLANFLLPHMPNIKTVLFITAPRDFEDCTPSQTEFFNTDLATAYISRWIPVWLPYVSGFRPIRLARDAYAMLKSGAYNPARTARYDAYGSSVLTQTQEWRPAFKIDRSCFDGLTRLETIVFERGGRLIIGTLPVMESWRAVEDPDGSNMDRWMQGMRDALKASSTRLIDGRDLPWRDSDFADPVHVLFPFHTKLTEFYAARIREFEQGASNVAPSRHPSGG